MGDKAAVVRVVKTGEQTDVANIRTIMSGGIASSGGHSVPADQYAGLIELEK